MLGLRVGLGLGYGLEKKQCYIYKQNIIIFNNIFITCSIKNIMSFYVYNFILKFEPLEKIIL